MQLNLYYIRITGYCDIVLNTMHDGVRTLMTNPASI